MANGFSLFGDFPLQSEIVGVGGPTGIFVDPLEFPDFGLGTGDSVAEPSIWGSIWDSLPDILGGVAQVIHGPNTQQGTRTNIPTDNRPTVVVSPSQIPQAGTQQGGFVPGFALQQPSFFQRGTEQPKGIFGFDTTTVLLVGGGAVVLLLLFTMGK